jgi:hypothetical protein
MTKSNLPNNQSTINKCAVANCERPVPGKHLCRTHRERLRRKGNLEYQYKPSLIERFWQYVEKSDADSCWNWKGALTKKGYSVFSVNAKYTRGHRFSYELAKGKIPKGLVVDHLCRNTSCVNPNHLEAVSGRINILRGLSPSAKNATKTHCPKNHEYTYENTGYTITRRYCKQCKKERARATRWARKSAKNESRTDLCKD